MAVRTPLPLLDEAPNTAFPPVEMALSEPNGLLAIGGDLSPVRLLNAYRHGIFPWFSAGQPILWWSPDPRMLFRTDGVHLTSRVRRELRRSGWVARADTAFDTVITACALSPRRGQNGTWITDAMLAAYARLHQLGHAHSVEVFDGQALVGGIYGVAIGRMFFGESMFSARPAGSKAALAALAYRLREWGWPLIDAQVESAHLRSLGADVWPRDAFMQAIAPLCDAPIPPGAWTEAFGRLPLRDLAG
jgi:leucyl/phenylalanyl-tRNA--protein transferase